ncbi:MAG: methyltransferase [Spirochaetota bacterium]
MADLKAWVNKTVGFRFCGADLRLDLSHALFSSFDVDVGTRLLFKAVGRDPVLARAKRVLDAGSGVGVIGLAIAAAFPAAAVTLRDRDLLAVAFSEHNRRANNLENAKVEPGLMGAGGLGSSWDFILSNVPAKAGGPVIAAFIAQAAAALAPAGRLGLVVVKPLVDEVRALLANLGFELVAEERGAMHRAFVCGLREGQSPGIPSGEAKGDPFSPSSFDLSAYVRRTGDFKLFGKTYSATGFWGLSDFDTIGYPQLAATELVSRFASGGTVSEVLVINPGIGHAALWIATSLGPQRLCFAGRDLLALHAARENLAKLDPGSGEDPPTSMATELLDVLSLDELDDASLDLLLDFADPVPEYDWVGPTWTRALCLLRRGGTLVIAAPPTELVRLERRRPPGFRLLGEKRKKGASAAAWRRT